MSGLLLFFDGISLLVFRRCFHRVGPCPLSLEASFRGADRRERALLCVRRLFRNVGPRAAPSVSDRFWAVCMGLWFAGNKSQDSRNARTQGAVSGLMTCAHVHKPMDGIVSALLVTSHVFIALNTEW